MPHMSSKRKRDELEDSDDEPSLGRQILPVANLPEDFDEEPMDGSQYLFTVRRDARYLPQTTRVANPYEITEAHSALSPDQSLSTTHPGAPSEEWRASFLKHFKNFRQNVIQPTIHIHIPQSAKHKVMPDKKQRDFWWAFLSGQPESDWNLPKRPKSVKRRHNYRRDCSPESDSADDLDPPQETWHINEEEKVQLAFSDDPIEALPTPSSTPAPSEHPGEANDQLYNQSSHDQPGPLIFKPREPTPSLIAYVDHRTSLHLLMYFTHWINIHLAQPDVLSSWVTESHARWIFILLSRVEDHILADDMSLLRNLARASIALLKESIRRRNLGDKAEDTSKVGGEDVVERKDHHMSERSCWIIITAIASVWGQRDLWMDVDAMLAGLTE